MLKTFYAVTNSQHVPCEHDLCQTDMPDGFPTICGLMAIVQLSFLSQKHKYMFVSWLVPQANQEQSTCLESPLIVSSRRDTSAQTRKHTHTHTNGARPTVEAFPGLRMSNFTKPSISQGPAMFCCLVLYSHYCPCAETIAQCVKESLYLKLAQRIFHCMLHSRII